MPEQKTTFCRICSPTCSIVAQMGDDGRIMALKPDRSHPVTKGFACHKGLNYLDIHYDPDRLNQPMKRFTGKDAPAEFEPVNWQRAMGEIGDKLRGLIDKYGPNAVGVYGGNPVSFNSKAFMGVYSLGARLGTNRTFSAATQDLSNKLAATEAIFGSMVFPIPDYYNTDYLLCLGTNPKISHWVLTCTPWPMHIFENIASRGGKIVHVNPRRIESVGPGSGELIQIRPDTDVYFIAAVLQAIDEADGFDKAVIAEHGKHIEGLREFIKRYPAERVAEVTGVSAEVIRGVAHDFSSARAASTHMATGLNQGRQGTLASWLLHMLCFVTGNLGREGGEYYARGYASTVLPSVANASQAVETPFGKLRPIFGAMPGNLLADFIDLEDDPVRALIVWSGNPLLSIGGEDRLREAFPKLELMVCVDLYRNSTAEFADYLLPAADWLERDDVNAVSNGMQPVPYVQFADAVEAPAFERQDDWWILGELEVALGLSRSVDPEYPLAGEDAGLAQAGLSIAALRAMPSHTSMLPQSDRTRFYEEAVHTPDKKVDCCPEIFAPALLRAETIFAELAIEDPAVLKLISLRTNYMHNGNLMNMKSLKRGAHAENAIHIQPEDAQERELADGEIAEIWNANGRLRAPVKLDGTLLRGVVALAHGYGHARSPGTSLAAARPGVNANALMPTGPGSFEPLSNMSHMTGIPVSVGKLRPASEI